MNTLLLVITLYGSRVFQVGTSHEKAMGWLKDFHEGKLPVTIGEIGPGTGSWSVKSADISSMQVFDPALLQQQPQQGPRGGLPGWYGSGGAN